MNAIVESVKRLNPELNVKEVVANSKGNGVIDVGDRAKKYVIDTDDVGALSVIGKANKNAEQLHQIMGEGQEGKRFQNKQLGLSDEDGNADPELVALIKAAVTGELPDGSPATEIELIGLNTEGGKFSIDIAIGGKWSTDILSLSGAAVNDALAQLSDIPAICELLPTSLDLKNKTSQVAVYDFDEKKSHFHGSDADVDSANVKGILSGSSMQVDEAAELVQYALSAEGQADDDVSVDFNGAGVIVEVAASRDTTDTMIFKGDGFLDKLTSKANGNPAVDLKNNASQVGVFDFDEAKNYFHGNDADVDSAAAKAILGGSKLDAGEAEDLVALALTGDDANVRYLGGDDDSAIVAIDASRDTVDTLFIQGDDFNFV